MTTSTVSNVRNIRFTLEDYGQEFTFMCSVDGTNKFGQARLQLPTTPDSENIISIDGDELDDESENYSIVYESLRDYFYADFHSEECGKASALLVERVYAIEEVGSFHVAFAENGSAHILKEGRLSSYYNVFYFGKTDARDFQDENESDIIESAENSLSKSLKNMTNANNSNKIIDTKKALVKQFDALLTKYNADEFTLDCTKMTDFDYQLYTTLDESIRALSSYLTEKARKESVNQSELYKTVFNENEQ